jgi:hypothetical protein
MKKESFDESLRLLIIETCKHSPQSIERQIGLTKIVRAIALSGKLWRENTPYYEDALQQTWLYFCRNLCEANTAQSYNPSLSSVTTWLDKYLKRRLQDYRQELQTQQHQSLDGEKALTPIAPPPVPPILEEVKAWVNADPDGELRRTHIRGHSEVNCQVLILRRLPPRASWEEISKEFNLPITTLNSFYQRQCFPKLRKFGESQGYL